MRRVAGEMLAPTSKLTAWSALLRTHAAMVPKLERELSAAHMPLSWRAHLVLAE